jgi:exosortase A-associated hydrolase 1
MSRAAIERQIVAFRIDAHDALGVLHHNPQTHTEIGVLVVVGGPQTRVGSHRAFVKLADALAESGVATLRFDTRGMGDSHGTFPGFEALGPDISAAIGAFMQSAPWVKKIVLWGLCDGASAILLNHGALPTNVVGAVLVNPWVHLTEGAGAAVAAQVQMKHYYLRKLTDGAFWRRLFTGQINPFRAAGELASTAKTASGSSPSAGSSTGETYVDRMRHGWYSSSLPFLVITAGDDLVAQEWRACLASRQWATPRAAPTVFEHLPEANHTFSTAQWRGHVEVLTSQWVAKLR